MKARHGIHNFRDYGDWRATEGARVRTGALFCSAHLSLATVADLERLRKLGVDTIVDLRHEQEQREQPGAWIGKLRLP